MAQRDGVVGLVLAGVLAWLLPTAVGVLSPRPGRGVAVVEPAESRGADGSLLAWTSSPTARDGWLLDRGEVPLRPIGGWCGLLLGHPLDLNSANAVDLEALPGIGPRTAAAVLAHRDAVGGFRSVADLGAVRGIGPATVRRLGPRLSVSPPPGSR